MRVEEAYVGSEPGIRFQARVEYGASALISQRLQPRNSFLLGSDFVVTVVGFDTDVQVIETLLEEASHCL